MLLLQVILRWRAMVGIDHRIDDATLSRGRTDRPSDGGRTPLARHRPVRRHGQSLGAAAWATEAAAAQRIPSGPRLAQPGERSPWADLGGRGSSPARGSEHSVPVSRRLTRSCR